MISHPPLLPMEVKAVPSSPSSPSRGIFISYRRADTGPYARLLQVQLSERFPDARVFMDLDSIEAGLDFADVIRDAISGRRGHSALNRAPAAGRPAACCLHVTGP